MAEQTVKCMISSGHPVNGAFVVVLGLTFKENCPDLRNSKVVDVIRKLESYGIRITVNDPRAGRDEAMHEYGISLTDWESLPAADAVVLAVAHEQYLAMSPGQLLAKLAPGGYVIDVKSALDRQAVVDLGFRHWRL